VAATGCATDEHDDTSKLKVVATIPPVADFVQQVGREHVDVTLMVPSGASPHTYEPTPGQMVEVSKADIYVKVGSGVEFEIVWLDKLLAQNEDIALVDCSEGIAIVNNDPHIWTSPILAIQMVENIVAGLSSADPDNGAAYESNGLSYLRELSALDDEIVGLLGEASDRHFLIYHPSFAYFAAEYDLVQLAIEHDGKPPTPQVLQASIDAARDHDLHYVFAAPQFAANDAQSVAEAIGGEVVFIDPLPDSYIPAMRDTTAAIARDVK
jgi:zinc transport system substrate-binding protein